MSSRQFSGSKRVVFLIALLAVFVIPLTPSGVADEPEVDLPYVIERLKEWRSSFANIRVEWDLLIYRNGPTAPLSDWSAPDIGAGEPMLKCKWIWADDGMLFYELAGDGPGDRSRTVSAYNGREGMAFRSAFQPQDGGAEKLRLLTVRGPGTGKPISVFCPPPLDGMYWNGSVRWLPEVLSDRTWISRGFEEIGGYRCLRLVTAPDTPGLGSPRNVWLDPDRGCLVRRFMSTRDGDADLPWVDVIVDEFQQLPDGQWFPKRGRMQLQPEPINQLWVVTDVAFNEQLDIKQFRPPEPEDGTLMDDRGRSYVHGQQRRVSVATDVPDSKVKPSERQTGPTATPPATMWWWSAGLAVVSLLFLSLGVWFRWRRRNLENVR
ncbi:MAG TPA: hypothetical protein VMM56_00050 [Planctomycetaceae bacterium]|nr:hypothetical protein [Planctomycetaceae bacterium]